jgi:diguanylate cyclase (GGDEF)-like protein
MLDISARRRDEEALKEAAAEMVALNCELGLLSTTDPLTGISNRRHLDEALTAACQAGQRHGDQVSVLLIDIDHFKQVNDQHGHNSGDQVLKIVTRRLASTLRTDDTLGRWGGEEFLVVLPRTGRAAAVTLAERLRRCVADEPVPVSDGNTLAITVSIGVASATHPAPDRLLAVADRAMYSAKEAGRNRIA